ncbi:MAG: FAD-dependent thymidylate synthase [Candidatus Heimdallarchaeota archaeon]|nr:FAD-dependent thymidylate synthase [Candidatus Heimdallarchaeota archaeon]
MEIELLQASDEKIVELAIRMCRGKRNIPLEGKVNEALIKRVIDSGHESVAEHAYFTFRISGISRVTTHQLVRHRIASFSQESQRYADPLNTSDTDWVVIPDSILQNPKAYSLAEKYLQKVVELRKQLDDLDIPLEDSRYFLPNACKSAIVLSMNARSLWNFFDFRICNQAQWEIRKMAKMMFHLVKKAAPALFNWWTPRCNRGCPEHCGNPVSLKLEEGVIIEDKKIAFKGK